MLTLLQKAAVFDNLRDKIKQARQKLQRALNDFDERYGLAGLESLPPELIEKNIDKIDLLAQMPLKERPAFKHMFDIMSQIDLTDEMVILWGRTDAPESKQQSSDWPKRTLFSVCWGQKI